MKNGNKDLNSLTPPLNLSSTEYHIHKSLKIGKIFKIKFSELAVANCPAKIFRCLCSALHSLREKPRKIVNMVIRRTQVYKVLYNEDESYPDLTQQHYKKNSKPQKIGIFKKSLKS